MAWRRCQRQHRRRPPAAKPGRCAGMRARVRATVPRTRAGGLAVSYVAWLLHQGLWLPCITYHAVCMRLGAFQGACTLEQ